MQTLTLNNETKEAIIYCGQYIRVDSIIKRYPNCHKISLSNERIFGYDSKGKQLFSLPSSKTNVFEI